MELKEFIKQALLSVVDGVEEANQSKDRFRLTKHTHGKTGESGQIIEFDISVAVNEASENSAGGGIKVALLNLGGQLKASESNQNTHKIKFEVFVSEK